MHIKDVISDNCLFYIIDEEGLDFQIDRWEVDYYIAENKKTIKIEGLEEYYKEYSPKTVHMYISPQNAKSFGPHRDPYDVTIKVLSGTKTFKLEEKEVELQEDEVLHIPSNMLHEATNKYDSIILSIGD